MKEFELPELPETVAGYKASFVREYALEAVRKERYVLDLLLAAGHVTEERVAKAREIAAAIRGQAEGRE